MVTFRSPTHRWKQVTKPSKGHLAHKLSDRDLTWSEIEKALDRSTNLRANSKRFYRIRLDIFERYRFTKCSGQVATLRMVQDYFDYIIHGSRITDLFMSGLVFVFHVTFLMMQQLSHYGTTKDL